MRECVSRLYMRYARRRLLIERNYMMKRLTVILTSICLLLTLCACDLPIPGMQVTNNTEQVSEREPSVYFLNSDAEADAMWQELAAAYTAEKGTAVTVVTPKGDYEAYLKAELDKRDPPTVFTCLDGAFTERFEDYCLELDGQPVLQNQITESFNFKSTDGKTVAVGIDFSAYGVAANEELLELAGYTLADVTDLASMKVVADDIHARFEELGFDAFSTAVFTGEDNTEFIGRILNSILYYQAKDGIEALTPDSLIKLKNVFDLYSSDSLNQGEDAKSYSDKDALVDFTSGKTVFYLCDASDYSELFASGSELSKDKLVILPIYCGADTEGTAAPSCTGGLGLAVNNEADTADAQAALDFITWSFTSEKGISALKAYYGLTVFYGAIGDNLFYQQACQYITEGKYLMPCAFDISSKADVLDAIADTLAKYFDKELEWNDAAAAISSAWEKADS